MPVSGRDLVKTIDDQIVGTYLGYTTFEGIDYVKFSGPNGVDLIAVDHAIIFDPTIALRKGEGKGTWKPAPKKNTSTKLSNDFIFNMVHKYISKDGQ